MAIDCEFTRDGSMIGLFPRSDAAEAWIADNVESEPWQWLGPILWIDHRTAGAIAAGMAADGLDIA